MTLLAESFFKLMDGLKVHMLLQDHGATALRDDLLHGASVSYPHAGEMGNWRIDENLGTHERRRPEDYGSTRIPEAG